MKDKIRNLARQKMLLLSIIVALLVSADAFVGVSRSPRHFPTSLLCTSDDTTVNADNTDSIAKTSSDKSTKRKLSRPERKALERQKKQQKQANEKRNKAKAKAKYSLHSTAVSELSQSSTAEDVTRAIKRAQKLHDHNDLRVIADFLIDECDIGFAYGYRGSLLARLAVAALHFGNTEVARRAITIRRLEYRPSMMPMESAAIIRGLLRVHKATEAMEVLHDELALPLEVRSHTYITKIRTISLRLRLVLVLCCCS